MNEQSGNIVLPLQSPPTTKVDIPTTIPDQNRAISTPRNNGDDVSKKTGGNKHSSKGSLLENVNIGPEMFVSLRKGDFKAIYNVGKTLGEGAYGKVCILTHKTTMMQRAMKAVKKSSVVKDKEMELFNEVSLLKQLDHPNIIKLFELFQDEGHYYLITELILYHAPSLCGSSIPTFV